MAKNATPAGRNGCLLDGGEPNPLMVWQNLEAYGYDCPKSQFVLSPQQPSLDNLARVWGVPTTTINKWKAAQGWDIARRKHWGRIAERSAELSQEAIARLQAREIAERIAHWSLQRESVKADLRRGYIETQSSSGKINQVLLSPADKKNLAQTLVLIEEQLDKCMALDEAWKKIKEAQEGNKQDALKANGIVLNLNIAGHAQLNAEQMDVNQLSAPVQFNPLAALSFGQSDLPRPAEPLPIIDSES